MKALISAAGWKGAGDAFGLGAVPEPFLPLGDWTTTLTRHVEALAGMDIYIGIGKRGYPYSAYRRAIVKEPFDKSPWTQERYGLTARLGTVL